MHDLCSDVPGLPAFNCIVKKESYVGCSVKSAKRSQRSSPAAIPCG